jgi:hypothetical protein
MWQIIWTDGFARETKSEHVVCKDIVSEWEAKAMLEGLHAAIQKRDDHANWYRLAPNDEEPYTFEP